MKTLNEQIFSDGSGFTGLYEVYGFRVAASVNWDRSVRVDVLTNTTNEYTSPKRISMMRSAHRQVEKHIQSLIPKLPEWKES
jgi:hypothetical protein